MCILLLLNKIGLIHVQKRIRKATGRLISLSMMSMSLFRVGSQDLPIVDSYQSSDK